MDLNTDNVGTKNEVAVLDGNRGTDVHELVTLHQTLGVVSNSLSGHVVSVDLLAIDVNDDTVGGLDSEGKGGIVVEVVDSEGLSEVGSGSSKVAELTRLGLLPGGGGTALRLGPVGRSRGTAVQVLIGSGQRSDEVANVEVEVLGSLIGTKRTEKNDGLISKEDSEVTDIPTITTAIGKGEGVHASGSALREVVGLSIAELALCEKRATSAVLQSEAHLTTSVTGLDKNGELVVGIKTLSDREGDLSRDSLALGSLGGNGVGIGRHGGSGSTTNGTSGGIDSRGSGGQGRWSSQRRDQRQE